MSIVNPVAESKQNIDYRNVRWTMKHSQGVYMSLLPDQDIGWEKHTGDQIIQVIQGSILAMIRRLVKVRGKQVWKEHVYKLDSMQTFLIPAGTVHNVVNASHSAIAKLYSIYAPPEHGAYVKQADKPKKK